MTRRLIENVTTGVLILTYLTIEGARMLWENVRAK